ncbi:MAG TPA: HK97-gp10 family putative phage morphogenesis protein [Bacteroidia bacterium]|nr:HK97-gp10 family putative phage morphogenesis protein [Bacteroidia bacterium]
MFSIQLNGIDALQDNLAVITESLSEEVKTAVVDAVNAMAENAKSKAPGKLADSITTTIADDGMSASIIADSPYAVFVEYGVSIPEIHAEKAKVLHWVKDGKDVFSRSARAHEIPAKPFLNPAFEEQSAQLKDTLKDIIGQ